MCLALKYVVYEDPTAKPVVSQTEALSNLATINSTWSQCNITFQIDQYLPVDPTKSSLAFNTANSSELDSIRKTYEDTSTLLVVTTGTWNRAGTLGSTGANAWTNMPGNNIYGAILEATVGTYPLIIAHELGHYLNLDHASDATDLMNPLIYSTSTTLTQFQCTAAQAASRNYWKAMLR